MYADSVSSALASHWSDILAGAFISALGWFVDSRFRGLEEHIKNVEKCLEKERDAREQLAIQVTDRLAKIEATNRLHNGTGW